MFSQMASTMSLLCVLAVAAGEVSPNLRGSAIDSLYVSDCSEFCCWWPSGDCGSCGDDWNNRMYPPGCKVPCTGANCGPGQAHQYFNTQEDWKSSCSTQVCNAPSLALPGSTPAPAALLPAEAEVPTTPDCSEFCCWWPEGDCGSCGDDWNNRMYAPGCEVPCTGVNCGPGQAHQYFNTQEDWKSSCSTQVCNAPSLALPASTPAPATFPLAESELVATPDCSEFCCWWPEGDCGSCGDDWNNRMYAPGCEVPCTGANCGPGQAHQYFNTQEDWKSSCSTKVCNAQSLALPESTPAPAALPPAEAEVVTTPDCSEFCCWWPEGDCGSCGDDWNNRMYAPGCEVPCTGANCGPGQAHQYFNTQEDWKSSCSTQVCNAPSLALPESTPAPATSPPAEAELVATPDCSEFCCWWPEGDCGSCGDDWNNRMYAPGCEVPCTGANCGPGQAHQYFNTQEDWKSSCSTQVCNAPSLALPESTPAPVTFPPAEAELVATPDCSEFCCWWPEGDCGSCGDDWNNRMYAPGCEVPCTGANCGPGRAHQYFNTQEDWKSSCSTKLCGAE